MSFYRRVSQSKNYLTFLLPIDSNGITRIHFYGGTVLKKGIPWHRDNHAKHISGWWFRVPLSFIIDTVFLGRGIQFIQIADQGTQSSIRVLRGEWYNLVQSYNFSSTYLAKGRVVKVPTLDRL